MAGVTRRKYSTNSRPRKITIKINKIKTEEEQTSKSQYQHAKIYVRLRKSLKLAHLIVRLNARARNIKM